MTTKKVGPFKRFAQVIREIRKQPLTPKALEELNCVLERNGQTDAIITEDDQSSQSERSPWQ